MPDMSQARPPKRFLLITAAGCPEVETGNIARSVIEKCGGQVLRIEGYCGAGQGLVPPAASVDNLCPPPPADDETRLSRAEYQALYGDDIDFDKINMKEDWLAGWPEDAERLNPESVSRQRLRGMAGRVEGLLKFIKPDAVLLNQPDDPISLIILAKALKCNIPVFPLEPGVISGQVYFELYGQHFYSDYRRLDALFKAGRTEVDPTEARELLRAMKGRMLNQARAAQTGAGSAIEPRELKEFCEKYPQRVILLPEQDHYGSDVLASLSQIEAVRSLPELYLKAISELPDDVGLVFKRRPADGGRSFVYRDSRKNNVLFLDDVPLVDLFKQVNAVMSFTSWSGLEAALAGLPLLSLGTPVYAGKGFSLQWDGRSRLTKLMEDVLSYRPDEESVARFIYLLKKEVLFSPDSGPEDLEKLCAGDEFTPKPAARAPFWPTGSNFFADYYDFLNDYSRLFYQNYSYLEIMARLGHDAVDSPSLHLHSGERQTAPRHDGIDRLHLERYALASELLPKQGRVLDAGCGTGYGAKLMIGRQPAISVWGFDACQEAVESAELMYPHDRIEYKTMSAGLFCQKERLEAAGSFDLIAAFSFLEHLPDPESFINTVKKLMTSQAVLIGSVPYRPFCPLGSESFHIRHYRLDELLNFLNPGPDEHCQIFYQGASGITSDGNDRSVRNIIFILAKDRRRLESLNKLIPFAYSGQSASAVAAPEYPDKTLPFSQEPDSPAAGRGGSWTLANEIRYIRYKVISKIMPGTWRKRYKFKKRELKRVKTQSRPARRK